MCSFIIIYMHNHVITMYLGRSDQRPPMPPHTDTCNYIKHVKGCTGFVKCFKMYKNTYKGKRVTITMTSISLSIAVVEPNIAYKIE